MFALWPDAPFIYVTVATVASAIHVGARVELGKGDYR
jgi:hypothetical protein